MTYLLSDLQTEQFPFLLCRWKCNDAATHVVDDIGGITIPKVGTPTFQGPPLGKNDITTACVYGSVGNYFSLLNPGLPFSSTRLGVTVEALSAQEPNGNSFAIFGAPGWASLVVSGSSVTFSFWGAGSAAAPTVLTASNVLYGPGQHIVGTMDESAGTINIYVDGALVATAAAGYSVAVSASELLTAGTCSTASHTITGVASTSGMVTGATVTGARITGSPTITAINSSTSFSISNYPASNGSSALTVQMPVQIAAPYSTNTTQSVAQDVALYYAPLSANRVLQHFQAFRQILLDPGHVRVYPQILVQS
jgi:hypothetical protein